MPSVPRSREAPNRGVKVHVIGLIGFAVSEGNRSPSERIYTPARGVFLSTTHCVSLLSSLVTGLDAMQNTTG